VPDRRSFLRQLALGAASVAAALGLTRPIKSSPFKAQASDGFIYIPAPEHHGRRFDLTNHGHTDVDVKVQDGLMFVLPGQAAVRFETNPTISPPMWILTPLDEGLGRIRVIGVA
jgi:hypothetical protein